MHLLWQKCAQIDPQTPKIARLLLSVTEYCTCGTATPTKLGDDHGGCSYDLPLLPAIDLPLPPRAPPHQPPQPQPPFFASIAAAFGSIFVWPLRCRCLCFCYIACTAVVTVVCQYHHHCLQHSNCCPYSFRPHSHHQCLIFCCRHRFISVSTANCQRVCRRYCHQCLCFRRQCAAAEAHRGPMTWKRFLF